MKQAYADPSGQGGIVCQNLVVKERPMRAAVDCYRFLKMTLKEVYKFITALFQIDVKYKMLTEITLFS